MDISPTGESGETATCPLMLKSTLEPRDSPVQCKKKYANQHWPAEHLNKQPSVIFKVPTVITPTIALIIRHRGLLVQNVHAAQATVPISQIRRQFLRGAGVMTIRLTEATACRRLASAASRFSMFRPDRFLI